jgi:hypothetical protein
VEPLPAAALAGVSIVTYLLARRVRALLLEIAELRTQLDGISSRLAATEQDVVSALDRTAVAETVLLDKGLADEEDLEAARRRPVDGDGDATGDLH